MKFIAHTLSLEHLLATFVNTTPPNLCTCWVKKIAITRNWSPVTILEKQRQCHLIFISWAVKVNHVRHYVAVTHPFPSLMRTPDHRRSFSFRFRCP